MESILDQIIARKKQEVAMLEKRSHALEKALKQPGLSVIAEIKRRSPSAGNIGDIADPASLAQLYEAGGAAAISVLTDHESFGGCLDDLKNVKKASTLPLLRKDFIIAPLQMVESIAAGASAVLLIVAVTKDQTEALFQTSQQLGLDALVEVHTDAELDIALKMGARLIMINNRNLHTFEVDPERALKLKARIPENIVTIAASGMKTLEETQRYHAAGFDGVLIGQMLVESEDPQQLIQQIRGIT